MNPTVEPLLAMARDRIIVPLDVATEEQALQWVDRLPNVKFWKVGLELFISSGPTILTALKERQKRIFLDLKLHDIPNTLQGAVAAATRYRVDLLTVHATAGQTALQCAQATAEQIAASAGSLPPQLVAVTLLTSLSATSLANELQVSLALPDYVLKLAKLAQVSGLAGVVCSPQEAALLRQNCGGSFLLVCPGVRPSWSVSQDQQRTLTPFEAIRTGASYLVIGRPITSAPDPIAAFQRICEEIAPLFNVEPSSPEHL